MRSVKPDGSLNKQTYLILELEKTFNAAVAGFVTIDEIRAKINRTDREAPRKTPEMVRFGLKNKF